jgi:hypothetical protein
MIQKLPKNIVSAVEDDKRRIVRITHGTFMNVVEFQSYVKDKHMWDVKYE